MPPSTTAEAAATFCSYVYLPCFPSMRSSTSLPNARYISCHLLTASTGSERAIAADLYPCPSSKSPMAAFLASISCFTLKSTRIKKASHFSCPRNGRQFNFVRRGLLASCGVRRKAGIRRAPSSSVFGGLLLGGKIVRFALFEGASCCGMHSEGNPSGPFVLGLQGLELMRIKYASRLTTVAAAVSFGIAAVLLWVKYERCVNESVDGGVFR